MHQLRVSWSRMCEHWGGVWDQSTHSGGTELGGTKIGYKLQFPGSIFASSFQNCPQEDFRKSCLGFLSQTSLSS